MIAARLLYAGDEGLALQASWNSILGGQQTTGEGDLSPTHFFIRVTNQIPITEREQVRCRKAGRIAFVFCLRLS